ncbi:DUF402 domain-containing protein [Tenggerimyces flavus]|uniref:DUF402 domain-containing protein n=1 Tax=Tenggerimyces flavus TaxID=1708749 RepID=A0ABV7YBP8_9ACTN|nr:DUF402 domain-containing protein [Tenggerimyces flavus]MBM7791340.1 putative RNA-binding protein associated with RNAse of E/G family [Tenggerimyces flavus]
MTFDPGASIARRDIHHDRVWSVWPCRVLSDTATRLVVARWPGAVGYGNKDWIRWLRTGDDTGRKSAIASLADNSWELAPWPWQWTTKVISHLPGKYFSVDVTIPVDGMPLSWYVNFERPFRRTAIGIDTLDLALDLVVAEDLTYAWKDLDEYDRARRLGIIDDTEHQQVEAAREEVVDLIEHGNGPFTDDWSEWRPSPEWKLPTLPDGALTVADMA